MKNKEKEKNSQAPDYLKLMKVLNKMGYEIKEFKDKSDEWTKKYSFTISQFRS